MNTTTNINWKAIAGKIRKEKCVLVLGPGAYHSNQGTLLQEDLLQHLDSAGNPDIQKYYPDDNFFLFNVGGGRAFTCEKIEDFYQSKRPSPSLHKIAKIPFHVILTVTPDKLMQQALQQEGFPHQFDYYKKQHEPAVIKNPSKELPLIYNLFGCVENEESLILTHNDLYDYFKSIFSRKSMPEKLKQCLLKKEINCFLFLGIPFDKWYMQLLLRELEIHRNQADFIRYAANQMINIETKTFCSEQFTIQFVDQNIPQFIDKLYETCEQEGLLREKRDQTKWGQLRNFIAKGNITKALEGINIHTQGTELEDEAIGIAGRYRRFKRKELNGVLETKEINIQENRITKDLLELITEAETL